MNTTTRIRQKYFNALNGLKYDGVEVPIFADLVNPNETIPIIKGAETYIILQDQQTNDASIQTMCDYDLSSFITVRIVTKFGLGGSKINCEDIAKLVDTEIRNGRDNNKIGIKNVILANSHTIVEVGQSNVAFQYILTYNNIIKEE